MGVVLRCRGRCAPDGDDRGARHGQERLEDDALLHGRLELVVDEVDGVGLAVDEGVDDDARHLARELLGRRARRARQLVLHRDLAAPVVVAALLADDHQCDLERRRAR